MKLLPFLLAFNKVTKFSREFKFLAENFLFVQLFAIDGNDMCLLKTLPGNR